MTDEAAPESVVPKDVKTMFQTLSEDELKQLAIDIKESKVFTDRHIDPKEDPGILASIFLPIALGAFAGIAQEQFQEIGLIYGYIQQAGPRSVNGYPVFFNMQMLSNADAAKVDEYVGKLIAAQKAALSPGQN